VGEDKDIPLAWTGGRAPLNAPAGGGGPGFFLVAGPLMSIGPTVLFGKHKRAVTPTSNFIIVVGDPGLAGEHFVGSFFQLSGATHQKEVNSSSFRGVPSPGGATVNVVRCSSVTDFVKAVSVGNVAYLAYFGHSEEDALFIGQRHAPDTNLSNRGGSEDTPISKIPKTAFIADAQIRLFGCKAGFGSNSIAEQIAKELGIEVFAYDNPSGAFFTQDPDLGHGLRAVKPADKKARFNPKSDTWMVPFDGTPTFKRFP